MCHFQAFWVGLNPTRNNFLRFLKQNITKGKNCEKIGKFRRNIGKSRRNIGIYRKKSGKIGQKKFLCIFLFEAHRKTIFRPPKFLSMVIWTLSKIKMHLNLIKSMKIVVPHWQPLRSNVRTTTNVQLFYSCPCQIRHPPPRNPCSWTYPSW